MTKGGIVLVKLKKLSTDNSLAMQFKYCQISLELTSQRLSYEDSDGKKYTDNETIQFVEAKGGEDIFQNTSVRKAILLVRYVNFMKHFLRDSLCK
jgi:hypothetical protein